METANSGKRTVATNGIELAYIEQGQGEPLVLIMGLGADHAAWELHLDAYRRRFRCFAVDNRGAGVSTAPAGPYSTAQMADDYAGLIDELAIGPVRVIGISMGGAIAQELALRRPDLVERLVLVSSWARCDEYTAEIFRQFAAVRGAVEPAAFTQVLQLWIWSPRYVNEHLDELRDEREQPAENLMTQQAFEAQCAACIDHDALARLGDLRVPTLLTAGNADIFTPLRLAHELRDHIGDSRLEIFPDAGHAHHWEAVDKFNDLTTRWLS
jgi:pimeloyl-ACP methyl ester carboxylesterase